MNMISNFVKTTLAFITGDTDKQVALANERKAYAAFSARVSKLDYEIVTAEEHVADAVLNLAQTIHPSIRIEKGDIYLTNIKQAQQSLDKAEAELEGLKKEKAYWEGILKGESEKTEE